MENLWNQMRGQLTGSDEKKPDLGATRDQKIPIQKTQSFKAEKKRGQNWFQKQLPMKRSHDFDSFEIEHAAAVAAAAFSINLQEAYEKTSETPETSSAKTKSKVGSSKSSKSILASASKRLSGSFRYKDDQGDKVSISSVSEEKKPEKASTLTDKKPVTPTPKAPPPPPPPPLPPPPPPPAPPIQKTSRVPSPLRQTTTGTNIQETDADVWERTELNKIRQRYEKQKEMIDSWQDKKRMKAKRKLIKHESDLERRRFKALKKFQNKMKYVNQVADGARAKADENRKNEELQAKGKAGAIRTTGKLPRIYFCF